MAFFGSVFANCIPVGVYTTNGSKACNYICQHSNCEAVVVENTIHLNKYLRIWHENPQLKYIIVYNDEIPLNIPLKY